MNSFLPTGGGNFTMFLEGDDPIGGQDLDAPEVRIAASGPPPRPAPNRIAKITPP